MPLLKNLKHENFAQAMVRGAAVGWSPADAYQAAGYKPSSRHAAEVCASRLLSLVEVRDRIAELQAAGARKAVVTVETLLAELEAARAAATSAEQFSAATAAIVAKAKLTGLMRDRVEVGGPGAFDRCGTPTEVVDQLLAQLGDGADVLGKLDELRELVEARLADRARALPQ